MRSVNAARFEFEAFAYDLRCYILARCAQNARHKFTLENYSSINGFPVIVTRRFALEIMEKARKRTEIARRSVH